MLRTVLFLGLAASGSASAADVIRRCQAADGTTVYTDQPCEAHGAKTLAPPEKIAAPRTDGETSPSERRAPGSTMNSSGALSLGGVSRSDCVRRTDTLLFEIRAAIETRNVNRLASVYDWAGKDADSAGGILARLARITERPLANVEFRYREPAYDTDPFAVPMSNVQDERPIGVRIEQMAPGDIAPSFAEDLRLVRNADCWWVSF